MQTSKMVTTLVNSLKPSTTVAKLSMLDIYGGAGYAADMTSDLVCGDELVSMTPIVDIFY